MVESNSRFYEKQKRSREDYCNICCKYSTLTYDHIPPKCCYNDIKAEPIETMSGQPEKYNPFCTQNGVKFRSICTQCNNGLLAKYDKALEEFVVQIKQILLSEEKCTHRSISIRVNAIARSVCGHILAMKDSFDDKSVVDQILRDFVQDTDSLPPKSNSLLMRYYPFSTVFYMRDAAILNIRKKQDTPGGLVSVLSSFPVAYILCDNSTNCGMINLFEFCTRNIEDRIEIDFDFSSAYFQSSNVKRDPKWPCNIVDHEYGSAGVLCSKYAIEESIFASRNPTDIKARFSPNKKSSRM